MTDQAQGAEFARWMNPILRALTELGGSARPQEVVDLVAKNENVSAHALEQLNPAGGQRFGNQVHWARFYLAEAGLIDRSRRGVWKLTDDGASVGQLEPDAITGLVAKVQQDSQTNDGVFREKRQPTGASIAREEPKPVEQDDLAPEQDDRDYRARLLQILTNLPAAGFERLCQRLLREAGFEQVVVTGKSGDGGIDGHGILALNAFVSFRVLFQCKRYSGSVSPSHVRDFRGAMQGRADKGLLLTTGSFSADARREASRDGAPPIELVDSVKLIELFSTLGLGLEPVTTYEIKESFFAEYKI